MSVEVYKECLKYSTGKNFEYDLMNRAYFSSDSHGNRISIDEFTVEASFGKVSNAMPSNYIRFYFQVGGDNYVSIKQSVLKDATFYIKSASNSYHFSNLHMCKGSITLKSRISSVYFIRQMEVVESAPILYLEFCDSINGLKFLSNGEWFTAYYKNKLIYVEVNGTMLIHRGKIYTGKDVISMLRDIDKDVGRVNAR